MKVDALNVFSRYWASPLGIVIHGAALEETICRLFYVLCLFAVTTVTTRKLFLKSVH